ncbi:Hint domain-containing protein [Jannaschia sp. 2305UL9-9]|uniref:Hint domain-containing protein n=1 Tax=Jannaschia sp. 2305UL9-9 TaxID=3121638 RepID=UPI003526F322
MLLDDADGHARLRRHLRATVAKLTRSRGEADLPAEQAPEEDIDDLIVTDGRREWTAQLVPTLRGDLLILFTSGLPPSNALLHIVQPGRASAPTAGRNTICFTPGTRILTEDGPRAVEDLTPGDLVLTRDDGPQPILWTGRRHISGPRLLAMPQLRPIRLKAGALGLDEPQPDLVVSPGHHVMLSGPKAHALWGTPEVLVRARDLLDDRRVIVDRAARDVTYIHLLFARHQVIWANRVEVESFHPGDADLGHMSPDDLRDLLTAAPGVDRSGSAYGGHARRCISGAELAILRHQGAPAYLA